MDLSLEEALKFGERLVQAKILHPLGGGGGTCQFSDSVNSIYRLQCFMTPNVLNTYRLWDEPGAATTDEVMDLLTRLNQMLSNAEMESLDTQTGQLDHAKARLHPSFARFEEAICEFQVVHLASCNMDHDTSLAFGINLYKVMLRYALLKIGIPTSEANRLHYMKHVQFDIGGQVFSFQDWVDGILRGNRKATYHARTPFGPLDSRRKLSLTPKNTHGEDDKELVDYRIHFALNLDSRFGSSSCPPFTMYTPDQLEEELEMAARIYCNDDVFVKIHGKDKHESDIILSQTFGWYRSDYTGNKRKDAILLSTIAQYLENYKASVKHSIRHVKTLQFRSISWATNAIHFSPYDKRSIVAEVKGFEKLMQRFVIAKPPENEELRLATLHSLNILDTLPEERFDRITKMVQEELQVPLVFVTYIDAIRQWMKSAQRPPSAPAVLEIPR